MASIKCAHCQETHGSVQEVRECAQVVNVGRARWNLYWRAHMDIRRDTEHPDDEDKPERQEDFRLWLEKVQDPSWFIAPGVTDEDRRRAGLPVDGPRGTLQSRMEEMHRAMEGPLFCGHIDKAGDLCAEPLELTAANEPTHEDRLINLEHDALAVSSGQLARLREGKPVDGGQLQQTQAQREQRVEPVTDGFYRKGDDIYKVQIAVHRSGRPYAKLLVLTELADEELNAEQLKAKIADLGKTFHRGHWEYAPGAIKGLRAENRLTVDEAVNLGRLYGMCVRCGKTLTKEESIERGMGDVCAGKGLVL